MPHEHAPCPTSIEPWEDLRPMMVNIYADEDIYLRWASEHAEYDRAGKIDIEELEEVFSDIEIDDVLEYVNEKYAVWCLHEEDDLPKWAKLAIKGDAAASAAALRDEWQLHLEAEVYPANRAHFARVASPWDTQNAAK